VYSGVFWSRLEYSVIIIPEYMSVFQEYIKVFRSIPEYLLSVLK
jgi:hypothetical protein